jgi:hypothetical protein
MVTLQHGTFKTEKNPSLELIPQKYVKKQIMIIYFTPFLTVYDLLLLFPEKEIKKGGTCDPIQ